MRIAILEIGNYYDGADIIRVFSSVKKAIENIPSEFKKQDSPSKHYYEDGISEKWLTITEYDVE